MSNFGHAIVVGASSGIGEAIARQLAREGSKVALVARREAELERICAEITASGGDARAYAHDVTDFGETAALFDRIAGELGVVDLVFYVAGAMPDVAEHEYAFVKDRRMVEVNLLGAMSWLEPAAALMEARGSGTLAAITSVAGDRGRRGNPGYCASKAGLATYLEGLYHRLHRYGVRVVDAKPGFVRTPLTAHLGELPMMVSAERAADLALGLARKGRRSGYVPTRWAFVMFVIRNIPSFIFRKLDI